MKDTVIVVGGGVAGLTAAHELIERGFDVHVYERREYFGGKAASTRPCETPGNPGNPAEHGFRFFPSWYRHLPDTLGRIPYRGSQPYRDAKTVLDNLIPIKEELLTWFNHEPLKIPTHVPRTLADAKTAGTAFTRLKGLGLAPGEMAFFAHKMVEFLMASDTVREARWEGVTWWQFLEADSKSRAYQDLIGATTRLMVAAKARSASAYSIGRLALRTFSDALTTVDRILNGPTSEVWIDPWVSHLKGLGVTFHNALELDAVHFPPDDDGKSSLVRVSSLEFTRVASDNIQRVGELLPVLGQFFAYSPNESHRPLAHGSAAQDAHEALASLRKLLPAILEDSEFKTYEARPKPEPNDPFDIVVALLRALEKALAAPSAPATAAPMPTAAAPSSVATAEPRHMELDKLQQLFTLEQLNELQNMFTPVATSLASKGPLPTFDRLQRLVAQIVKAWTDWKATMTALPGNGGYPVAAKKRKPGGQRGFIVDPAVQLANGILDSIRMSAFSKQVVATGEYFVFALPVEQMAYYVNRSTAMTAHAPSLRNLLLLTECTDWMAGIQFYLKEPFDASVGHIVCMDSNWSLTAIEQTQFWRGVNVGPDVQAIVSVDIAEWDAKGRYVPLEAYNCSAEEIAKEVWGELKASVNSRASVERLRDTMLVGGNVLREGVNFHLDDNIADVYDRKKQAVYELARSAKVDAVQAARDANLPSGQATATTDMPYIWGAARQMNAEPLLINVVGSRVLRPEAHTDIANMFLAADYVRTDTDLACMEGANEAARLAVNAVLDASGSLHPRCPVWPLSVTRDVLQHLTQLAALGGAQSAAAWATQAASRMTDLVMNVAGQAIGNFKDMRNGKY